MSAVGVLLRAIDVIHKWFIPTNYNVVKNTNSELNKFPQSEF